MRYNSYVKDLNCRVFDIETTGLYPGRDRIISASLISPDGSGLKQFFSENSSEELLTISHILSELEDCDAVITYNGQSFDLPFVLARARKYGLADELPLFLNLDIYRILRSYWPLAESMPSLRQKAVEEVLGISPGRTDEIDGGECIRLYSEYVNLGREEAKDLILLHNGDDVRQLAAVTRKLSFLPYDRISFEKGFLIKEETATLLGTQSNKILVKGMEMTADSLKLKAVSRPACQPAAYYGDGYKLSAGAKGEIELSVILKAAEDLRFADTSELPVDASVFEASPDLKSGYLILANEDGPNYDTCIKLAEHILRKLL